MKFLGGIYENKKIVVLASICLICALSVVAVLEVFATDMPNSENKTWLGEDKATVDAYNFPVSLDDKETWVEFAAMEITEKYRVCQIPKEKLNDISTQGLIETCVSYPIFGNIFAFDSLEIGYDRLKENFDGFKALNERKDAGETFLKMYKDMDLDILIESDPYSTLRLTFFNFIISQDEILDTMDEEMRAEFAKIVLEKINLIGKKYSEQFSIGGSIVLLDSILSKDNISFESYAGSNKYVRKHLELCIQSMQNEMFDMAEDCDQNPNNKYWIEE